MPPPPEPRPVCPQCGEALGDAGFCTPCLLRQAVARSAKDGPAGESGTRTKAPEAEEFGDYRILERLGEGAMGTVHRARKLSLRKDVAIKFMKAGAAATRRQRALFLREAELASQLDHPNIVAVTEVGERDAQPFLVMRFIDGRPLSERLTEPDFRPTLRERVALLVEVTRAVHHAHQRGVIHRDLKPGNILVDSDGRPFVGDFGLARWLQHDSTVTYGAGQAIGTPAFMSPEQAGARTEDVTVASDVWSLGVILYLLIAGRLPFDAGTVAGVVHRILHDQPEAPFAHPPRPHDGSSAGPVAPASDAIRLSRSSRHDLASVCLRCLEKSPARRYPTAAALADDLERWLQGRPVEARLAPATERLAGWVRRHPAAAGILGLATLALAGLMTSAWQRQVNVRTEHLRRLFNYVTDMNLALRGLGESNAVVFQRAMEARSGPGSEPRLRGLEAGLLERLGAALFEPVWFDAGEPLLDLAVSPRGARLLVAGTTQLLVFDARDATPRILERRPLAYRTDTARLAASPAGSAFALGTAEGLELLEPGRTQAIRLAPGRVSSVGFAPDGQRIAAVIASPDGRSTALLVFETDTGRLLNSNAIAPIAIGWAGSDTLRLADYRATVSETGVAETTAHDLVGPGLRCPSGRFSHGATRFLRTSIYGLGHVFAVPGGQTLLTLGDVPGNDAAMAFSADDRRVAIATALGSVRVETIPGADGTRTPPRVLMPGHLEPITAMAFGADDETVFTCSADHTLRRLHPDRPPRQAYVEVRHNLKTAAGVAPSFGPGDRQVALLESRAYGSRPTNDVTVLCDPATGTARHRLPGQIIGWGPGDRAISCDRDGRLRLWDFHDPAAGRELASLRLNPDHDSKLESQFADGGRQVVSVSSTGVLEAFEVATRRSRHPDLSRVQRGERPASPRVNLFSASPGSAFVGLSIAREGTWLWDIRRDRLFPLQPETPADIRFSPDGGQIAVTDYNRRLRLFDGRTGTPAESLPGHLGTVTAVAFSPDGRQLVTGGDDYMLVIWNLATRREVFRANLGARTSWITVSPDARWLVTGHLPDHMDESRTDVGPGRYRLWRLASETHASPGNVSNSSAAAPGDTIWGSFEALAREHPATP